MSKTVRDIANGIVLREGGFVNDPDDLGGGNELWCHNSYNAAARSGS